MRVIWLQMKLCAVFQSKCFVALYIDVPTALPFPCENNTQIIQATAKSLACDSEGELPTHSRHSRWSNASKRIAEQRANPRYSRSQLLSLTSKGRNGLSFSRSKLHCFFFFVKFFLSVQKVPVAANQQMQYFTENQRSKNRTPL